MIINCIDIITTEVFIKKARETHPDKYDCSKVEYINSVSNVIIICKEHREFLQTPHSHLSGRGCNACCNISRSLKHKSSTEEFIKKAIIKHGDKYDYSKVHYINSLTKVIINCEKHGEFLQPPSDHLSGCGCPKCSHRNYSKKAIQYLTLISKIHQNHIQHAENDGEYKLPNTRWSADGYCVETNTIYEFHGTEYHGDPRCCDPDECNYLDKNYGELYQNAKEREKVIETMGYNLVVMWEYDWNGIIKSVKILQRKFRELKSCSKIK
jgi:hypothetical protein